MIYRIEVWIALAGDQRLAGEMVCDVAEDGRGHGAFRYEREYLDYPGAIGLDPVSLPLQAEDFRIDHPGVSGVFQDSLPDSWGKRLLVRKHRLPRHQQNLPSLLLALGNTGLGALAFMSKGHQAPPARDTSAIHLDRLVREAELFEEGKALDSDISLLFAAGSSPGGARPKALVYDEAKGIHFLAKFPSTKDDVDVVRIETATMSLAARAGLIVPNCRLVQCGSRSVLMVERFDMIPAGRKHMISLQTLLKIKTSDFYVCRYFDLLEIVRRISVNPQQDGELLFRQMVFNAVVGNTDDHLKNFWMLCDENGWRLSPAFDLVPDIGRNGDHVLCFDLDSHYPGREKLRKLGKSWGIPRARVIVDEVFHAVSGWKKVYAEFGVADSDIERFSEIDRFLLG